MAKKKGGGCTMTRAMSQNVAREVRDVIRRCRCSFDEFFARVAKDGAKINPTAEANKFATFLGGGSGVEPEYTVPREVVTFAARLRGHPRPHEIIRGICPMP